MSLAIGITGGGSSGGSSGIGSIEIGIYSDAGFTKPITDADIGDTIYLRAENAIGITPVEYLFFLEDVDGVIYEIYKGANDNTSWVVEGAVGVGAIYVAATEDSTEPKDWVSHSIQFELSGDVDALAFLNATGITDPTLSSALTDMVVSLKSEGLWNKIHAFYPIIGGTSDAHKYNLKNPLDLDSAFRMLFFGGITHDANGMTGNGTNSYCDTLYNPLNEGQANTSNAMFYHIGTNAAGGYDMGIDNTTHYSVSRYGNNLELYENINGSISLGSNTDSIGFYINTRTSSTDMRVYKDGALIGSNTVSTSTAFTNASFKLMSLDAQYSSKRFQLAGIADGLTNAECIALSTINSTFQTTIGR